MKIARHWALSDQVQGHSVTLKSFFLHLLLLIAVVGLSRVILALPVIWALPKL